MSKKLGGGLEESSSRKSNPIGHNIVQESSRETDERGNLNDGESLRSLPAAGHTRGALCPPPLQNTDSITKGQTENRQIPIDFSAPRQVIAVSASKGPAAFFNLARKFLATDEVCDLSALEGAIVSAVDAAHLLERSKLATIVRVQTSYVAVEPKRKTQQQGTNADQQTNITAGPTTTSQGPATLQNQASGQPTVVKKSQGRSKGTPLRRARIVITVRRTRAYTLWLVENPNHLTGGGDDDIDVGSTSADMGARATSISKTRASKSLNLSN